MTASLFLGQRELAQDQPVLINITSEPVVEESALLHFLPLLFKVLLVFHHHWHLVVVRFLVVCCFGEAIMHMLAHDRVVVEELRLWWEAALSQESVADAVRLLSGAAVRSQSIAISLLIKITHFIIYLMRS